MQKSMKFKGQKVTISTDRIAEEDRDPDLYYYEIRHDADKNYLPIVIETDAGAAFWGTMIAEEEFEFNNGDMHTLNEALGLKLASAFGRAPEEA